MKSVLVRQKAAELVAAGQLPRHHIAKECGISLRCLDNWGKDPDFISRVDIHLRSVLSTGMADPRRRILTLTDLVRRCEKVLDARASDPALQQIPGIESGLFRRRIRAVAGRPIGEILIDIEPVRIIQSLLKQLAQEVQPLLDRQAHNGQLKAEATGAEPDFRLLSSEESAQFMTLLDKMTGGHAHADQQ